MATDLQDPKPGHPSLVRGGPSYHLARGLGLEPPTVPRRLGKIVLLVMLILFIQRRPRGMFPLKGRAAEA